MKIRILGNRFIGYGLESCPLQKEIGTMEKMEPSEMLESMDFLTLKALRDRASKRLKEIRSKKYLRVPAYIPTEVRDSFDIAVKWAYENKLTKKPSNWAFVQFAVVNTVKMIKDQVDSENASKSMTAGHKVTQAAIEQGTPEEEIQDMPESA